MTAELTAWHRIIQLWDAFLALKTSTTSASDGMPRAASNPAERAVLNLNILVLEIEITDLVKRHANLHRQRGGTANTLKQLLAQGYPTQAPTPEAQAWEKFGSDFLEEIEELLQLRPRPWTQHKLDLLAEYPQHFQLTQAQTLIALTALGQPIQQPTLHRRITRGTIPTDHNGRINLADALNQPVRKYERTTP